MSALAEKPLRQVKTVQELLINDMAKKQLALVAAQHMRPERMMRLMANAMRTTPKLGDCEPITLLGAMMTCASLGLEPNTVLGHAYLIPFGKSVQLVLGYKGMIDLARRSGSVVNIHADVVYEDDDFSFEYGTDQHLRHKPTGTRSKPIYAYCHAKLVDGEAFIVLPYVEVLKIRDSSQGYKTALKYGKKDTPWIAHEHQMARKTAVRALFNELPISIEKVSDALQIDDQKADYRAFAMDATADMPDMGETIDGTAEDAGDDDEEDGRPIEEEEKKPEPQKAKQADKPKAKPKEEKAPDPEPEPEPDQGEDDANAATVEVIKSEIEQADSLDGVDLVLEMYADMIDVMGGTPAYTQVQEAAAARREALA